MDLSSLQVKDDLNREIWDKNDKMDPEIRKHLLKIAKDFYKQLDIKAKLQDVHLTGSSANYNWSKYSDLDVHLIVDYKEVSKDRDLVADYFHAIKSNWNDDHDITIHGFDVEVYVEDTGEPAESAGVYSIENNAWISKPKKEKPSIDKAAIKRKVALVMRFIDDIQKLSKEEKYDEAIDEADKLSDKIKKMRKCGLDKGGEFSTENLAFKILRRNGSLDKLWNIKYDSYDDKMSID